MTDKIRGNETREEIAEGILEALEKEHIDDDGQAFPCIGEGPNAPHFAEGMSLRDWFAGQAMAGRMALSHACSRTSNAAASPLPSLEGRTGCQMGGGNLVRLRDICDHQGGNEPQHTRSTQCCSHD